MKPSAKITRDRGVYRFAIAVFDIPSDANTIAEKFEEDFNVFMASRPRVDRKVNKGWYYVFKVDITPETRDMLYKFGAQYRIEVDIEPKEANITASVAATKETALPTQAKTLLNDPFMWLAIAVKFDLGDNVEICRRGQIDGSTKWCVLKNEMVLSRSGRFEYEPSPSSRSEAFIKRTRFETKELALEAYLKFKK